MGERILGRGNLRGFFEASEVLFLPSRVYHIYSFAERSTKRSTKKSVLKQIATSFG